MQLLRYSGNVTLSDYETEDLTCMILGLHVNKVIDKVIEKNEYFCRDTCWCNT
jgi:hypothetical protein